MQGLGGAGGSPRSPCALFPVYGPGNWVIRWVPASPAMSGSAPPGGEPKSCAGALLELCGTLVGSGVSSMRTWSRGEKATERGASPGQGIKRSQAGDSWRKKTAAVCLDAPGGREMAQQLLGAILRALTCEEQRTEASLPIPSPAGLPESLSGADRGSLSREPEASFPKPAGVQHRQDCCLPGQPAHQHAHRRHGHQPVTSLPFPRAAQPRDNRTWPRTPKCGCIPPPHPEHAQDLLRLLAPRSPISPPRAPEGGRRKAFGGLRRWPRGLAGLTAAWTPLAGFCGRQGRSDPPRGGGVAGVGGEGSRIQDEVVKCSLAPVPPSLGAAACSLLGYVDPDDFQPPRGPSMVHSQPRTRAYVTKMLVAPHLLPQAGAPPARWAREEQASRRRGGCSWIPGS